VLFSTDAGGVGLNLQRAANCCMNLDLPWNPAVLEQRIGRIFRLGQSRPVDIYNLVAASGIEDRIAGLVGDKRALFLGLFDGSSDEVSFDSAGSFMIRMHELIGRNCLPPTSSSTPPTMQWIVQKTASIPTTSRRRRLPRRPRTWRPPARPSIRRTWAR
jgi:hypothetical protein